MPRAWRFNGPWTGWRRSSARADPPRLVRRATEAFVDRAPIDWTALRLRARAPQARAFADSLRLLDAIRGARAPSSAPVRAASLVRLVTALAALQTAVGLTVLANAALDGVVPAKAHAIVLTGAFSASALLLRAIRSPDFRGLLLLSFFTLSASAFARGALTGLPAARTAAIDPLVRGICFEAFVPGCLWLFALDFPRVRRFTRFDAIARRVSVAAWTLGVVLFGINLAAARGAIGGAAVSSLLREAPSNGFWRLFTLAVVPAVAAIFVRSRRAPPAERRRVWRFALALAAGLAPFLALGTLRTMIDGVDRWLLEASPADRAWIDLVVVCALAATPVLSTFAVVADRPFDVQALVRDTWRGTIVGYALLACATAPILALGVTIYARRYRPLNELLSGGEAALALTCIAAAGLLLFVRLRFQGRRIAGALGHGRIHGDDLSTALERLRLARGTRETLALLRRVLQDVTGAHAVHVLVRSGAVYRNPLDARLSIDASSGLVAALSGAASALDLSRRSTLRPLLPVTEREWLDDHEIDLAVPIVPAGGEVAALVLIGRRPDAVPFDRRDRWVAAMLTAAAIAPEDVAGAWDGRPVSRSRDDAADAALECRRCGIVAASDPLPCACDAGSVLAALPARLDDRFVVERRLGAGGMGVVYLARDVRLDRHVALKTLPELSAAACDRLRAEARAMAALRHESLATIYGLELWRHTPILVVEHFRNGTLARRLEGGPLAPREALELGIALARALGHVHACGMVHRDLKPGNIGIADDGRPKLLDFGLAAALESSRPAAGTRGYQPPEAALGAPAGPLVDLWALAVVLDESCPALRRQSLRLEQFFARALAPSPQRRFQAGARMQAELEAAAAELRAGPRFPPAVK